METWLITQMAALTMKHLEDQGHGPWIPARDFVLASALAAYQIGTSIGVIRDTFEYPLV